uniref:Lgl_C domain-containing protein n=1 Tax=Macrostomum lignano TaxID=282301 RepID=A0A1I8FZ23_9PLAT
SLRILYHFRVGSFNLAPVHRNPHTPVLVSAVLNRSAGAFVTGESGSFIGVSTANGIEDLFVPEPNVTVFMRAKFEFNSSAARSVVFSLHNCSFGGFASLVLFDPEKDKLIFRFDDPYEQKKRRFIDSSGKFPLSSGSAYNSMGYTFDGSECSTYFEGGLERLETIRNGSVLSNSSKSNKAECLSIGGKIPRFQNSIQGWIECFAIAEGLFDLQQLDGLSSWCKNLIPK